MQCFDNCFFDNCLCFCTQVERLGAGFLVWLFGLLNFAFYYLYVPFLTALAVPTIALFDVLLQ